MKPPSLSLVAGVSAALLGAVLLSVQPAAAAPILTITPLTWNVVGLDSNDVSVGPNNFPVGARVCNTGDMAAINVSSTFVWDTSDAFIDLRPGSLSSYTLANAVASLAPAACHDFYYEVQVTRSASAYTHTRRYHITATADGLGTVSTPTPREIFVERLISQNRNATSDVKLDGVSIPPGGTMALLVGSTYNIQLVASTATNGYEQLESFINFPNTIFRVNSVASTFTADGGTDPNAATKLYADGCGWVNDPNSPTYRSCVGVGKYGGNITVTYNVTIISGGGSSQSLNTLIYDFSGSSYHYNSDFGTSARIAAIIDPTLVTISKSFAPDPTIVGGTSTLTFTISNPNSVAISDLNFSDTFPTSPGAMVVANPTGASTSGCGTPTFAPVAGAGSISFSNGTVAANGSCLVRVNVMVPAAGTYTNTSGNLFIDTSDTGDSATDSLTANTEPPPPPAVCGLTLAQWNFTGITNPPPQPAPSTQAPDVGTAAISVGGTSPGSLTDEADGTSGNPAPSLLLYGWPNLGPVNTATFPFIQFAIDTSNYTQVNMAFDAERKANGPNNDEVYFGTDGVNWTLKTTFTSTTSWTGFGPFDFTGQTSTTGVTFFRIYGYGANTPSKGADLSLDNVTFTGCGTPNPPTITKSFSPDPVSLNGTSTLTLTITNPNATVALSGIAFSDTLPAGVTVGTSGPTSICGGALSTTAPGAITFSGGSLAAGASCLLSVTVTVTTAGPHNNVSGYISATESGQNTGAGGSASDSITAISPPSIDKLFAPNPILTGGVSTLTFTISNPNPDNALTGVAFSDTFPTTPGVMVVASPTGATTSGCGSPTYSPVAGAGSISFSGGTIAAGGTCTVKVDVTTATTGNYLNTSGSVSAATTGPGNTASDTLIVQPVHPGVSVLKRVSTSAGGPWTTFVGVAAGSNVFFQMTVENIGDVPLTSANVTDPTLTGQGVDLSGCSFANLAVFEVQTCVVGPVSALSGSNSNTATSHGTYSGTVFDSTPSTATYATTGLTLDKSVAEGFYTLPGNVLNYSYLVTNSGSATLAGPVVVSDDRSMNESCPDVSTVGDLDAFLDPGESISCTASYTIVAGDVTAGSVTNTASATAGGVTSKSDSTTVFVFLPELAVSKANDTGGSTPLATPFGWTLTVANSGPVAATFVGGQTIVSDPLPAGASYGSPTPGGFTGIINSANIACAIDGSNVLTCTAIGAAVTIGATTGSFAVSFNVTPSAAGNLANTATVDPNNVVNEAVEGNNTGSNTVTVVAPPTIAKAFSPSSITVGDTATLQFTLTNPVANTVALAGVGFTDTYPSGVVNSTPLTTTNSCGGTLTATAGGGSISLSGATIAVSSSCTVTVVVTAMTAGTKLNTSGAVSSTNGGTGNTDNNTLTVLVSDPAVTKTGNLTTAQVGDTVIFTMEVSNGGTADADNVVLTDMIPNFLDITSVLVSPSPPACPALTCVSLNTITLDFGTVSPGETFMVTVTTVVNSLGAPPGGPNDVSLSTTSTDSNSLNNSASFNLSIVALAALEAPETGFAPNRLTVLPAQPAAKAYLSYKGMWLEIPTLEVKTDIVGVPLGSDGWDVTWLSGRAGYLAGTAFPTWTGNSAITGHVALPSGAPGPFASLAELHYGDEIVVHAWGARYIYEVRGLDLVRPESPSIFRHEERAWVTLVTCAEYDEHAESYQMRRLARAVLMRVEASD